MYGKIVVIVDVIDQNRENGASREEQRATCLHPLRHLIPKKKVLIGAIEAADVKKKWESSSWGRKFIVQKKRASLNDFDRFKVMLAKIKRGEAIRRELHLHLRKEKVPSHIVGESEVEASKEGRRLTDFKYACVGYSVHNHMDSKHKDPSMNPDAGARNPSYPQGKRSELPFCIGIELLVDERPAAATADGQPLSQPQPSKPPQPAAEEFLPRFTRNANIGASGVLKNVYRVGNYINANVDDTMYPYRRKRKVLFMKPSLDECLFKKPSLGSSISFHLKLKFPSSSSSF
ncbi:hypothetical protein MKW98_000519 [Papaver atlanticum]|uniref:Ribosomal protein L14e domain-containing protein n=1 Tax=Papaver atlanticum TaxID=357466 RepID=A0AAD4X8Q6_9MAGN|nr:hypothetical protein MKW98_000519 [Papaver atlanticum]